MRISDWSSDVCSSDLFQGDKPDVRDVIERCDEASQLGFVVDNLDNEGTAILENAALVDVCRSAEPQPGFKNRDACQARSEERRVGKECVRTCRYRWSPDLTKKKQRTHLEPQT